MSLSRSHKLVISTRMLLQIRIAASANGHPDGSKRGLSHTSSICFPALSYKFCQNWLRCGRSTLHLRASVRRCCQPLAIGFGAKIYKTVEATASKHVRKHETPPPLSRFERFCRFYLFGREHSDGYKKRKENLNAWYNSSCLLQSYCHFITNEKLSFSLQVFETYVMTLVGGRVS